MAKKQNIVCEMINEKNELVDSRKATSVCNMWKVVKAMFAEKNDSRSNHIIVTKDESLFMDLHQVLKSNGKYWMVNDVKETHRKALKTAKNTEEAEEHEPSNEDRGLFTIADAWPEMENAQTIAE